MAFYHYDVAGKKIDEYNGEVSGVSPEFHPYVGTSFSEGDIYQKPVDGKLAEIICETSLNEKHARKCVQEFLDNLNIS